MTKYEILMLNFALVEKYPGTPFFDMLEAMQRVDGLLAKNDFTVDDVGVVGFHELLRAELGI